MKCTSEDYKQPNFLENAFITANEKIKTFRKNFAENHYKWLEEIYQEAKTAFTSDEVVLLPKTPSMKRKRKRVAANRKTTRESGRTNKDKGTNIDQLESPVSRQSSRASKRVKIANEMRNTSGVDLDISSTLNDSTTVGGGRQLRPRKAKNGKPPIPKRQSKRKTSKTVTNMSDQKENCEDIVASPNYQKVTVQLKHIDEDLVFKVSDTPTKSKKLYFSGSTETNKEDSSKKVQTRQIDSPTVLLELPKQFTSPCTPASPCSFFKSPGISLESSTKSTPGRLKGTPNSLQPKIAAIVKQFAEIEASAQLSPSPKRPNQKGVPVPSTLASKFSKHRRSSILRSAKKVKRLSRRSVSRKYKLDTKQDVQLSCQKDVTMEKHDTEEIENEINALNETQQHCESKSLFSDEEVQEKSMDVEQDSGVISMTSTGGEAVQESKQQQRKTYDLNPSHSNCKPTITVDISFDNEYHIADPADTSKKEDGSTLSESHNADVSQSIKRKTYDIDQSSSSLKMVDIVIDDVYPKAVQSTEVNDVVSPDDQVVEGSDVERYRTEGYQDEEVSSPHQMTSSEGNSSNGKSGSEVDESHSSPSVVVTDTPPRNGPKIVKGIKPPNLLSDVITSFIKRTNTPKKETEEDKKRLKEQDIKKKERMRQRKLEIIENKRKQEMEERKRRREERERRVAEMQAMKAREEEEKKRLIKERMEKVRDKEEKVKRLKEKEEEMKRKAREKKQAEVEARRRQEEEERKQKLLELEMEEKRKQEYLTRKAEYEEQYRARRAADLKKLEEQKLQEMEQERKLQEDRWRREIEEKAKKREEAERKAREEREREKQRRERDERERRVAAGKERKIELENQRTVYKQLVLEDREEKERKLAEIKEKHARIEKEKREREEKEKQERENLLKEKEESIRREIAALQSKLPLEKKEKQFEILKVVGKFLEENRSVPTASSSTFATSKPAAISAHHTDVMSTNKGVLSSSHTDNSISYEVNINSASVLKAPRRESSYVCYDIADMGSDDSTDDDEDPMHKVPTWAQRQKIFRALRNPDYALLDPDKIFAGLLKPPKLEQIFKKHTARFFKRTSSACWDGPILKNGRKVV